MNQLKLFMAVAICGLMAGCATTADTRADARADFLKIIDRPRVALAPQIAPMGSTNGIVEFYFSFASDAGDRVPGILMKLANSTGRRPVVIVLHGTSGSKTSVLWLCRRFAAAGFIAIAIDGRYHGERKSSAGQEDYHAAIVRAWHGSGEHPFYYDTVWDVMRLVDYLQTRDDVMAQRIGLMGFSKGGIETYFAAAADPRIAAAVPCIGMESFRWALAHEDWQGRIGTIQPAFDAIAKENGVTNADLAFVQKFYDRVVPGIYSEFDGPQMIALIAPRPLLLINSDSDIHTPLPGVQECVAAAEKIYAADNATNHFAVIIQKNAGHEVKPESERAAIDWFVQWLKP
jgi:dienelactone hydrolase